MTPFGPICKIPTQVFSVIAKTFQSSNELQQCLNSRICCFNMVLMFKKSLNLVICWSIHVLFGTYCYGPSFINSWLNIKVKNFGFFLKIIVNILDIYGIFYYDILSCHCPESLEYFVFIYLCGVLHHFQHCTGHFMTSSFVGRGNQYIQLVKILYCELPNLRKQLPTFPHRICSLNHLPLLRSECVTTAPP